MNEALPINNRVLIRSTEYGEFTALLANRATIHIELINPDVLVIHITPDGTLDKTTLSVHARRRELMVTVEKD